MSGDTYVEIGSEGLPPPTLSFFLNEIFRVRIEVRQESAHVGDYAVNVYMAGVLRDLADLATGRFDRAYVREIDLRNDLEARPPRSNRELGDRYRHNGDLWWVGAEVIAQVGRRQRAPTTQWWAPSHPREARRERMASFYDQALSFLYRSQRGERSGVTEALGYILRNPAKHVTLMDRVIARLLPALIGNRTIEGSLEFSRMSTESIHRFLVDQLVDLKRARDAGQPTAPIERTIGEIRAVLAARSPNHNPSTGNDPSVR